VAYHSAVPLFGAAYLQKVRAVWPWITAHPSWSEPEVPAAYAVLLSAQARLVRVVTPVARQSGWLPYCLIQECCREHAGCLVAMFPLHHLIRQLRITPDP
jgi:hypothetical protein